MQSGALYIMEQGESEKPRRPVIGGRPADELAYASKPSCLAGGRTWALVASGMSLHGQLTFALSHSTRSGRGTCPRRRVAPGWVADGVARTLQGCSADLGSDYPR